MSHIPNVLSEDLVDLADAVTQEQGQHNWCSFLRTNMRSLIHTWPLFNIYSTYLGLDELNAFEYEQLTLRENPKFKIQESLQFISRLPALTESEMQEILESADDAQKLDDRKTLRAFYVHLLFSKPVDEFKVSIPFTVTQPFPEYTLNFHHHYEIKTAADLNNHINIIQYSSLPDRNQMLTGVGSFADRAFFDRFQRRLPVALENGKGHTSLLVFSEEKYIAPCWSEICTSSRDYLHDELSILFQKTLDMYRGPRDNDDEISVTDERADSENSDVDVVTHTPSDWMTGLDGWISPSPTVFDDILYHENLSESSISAIFQRIVLKPAITIFNCFLKSCLGPNTKVRATFWDESPARVIAEDFTGVREKFLKNRPDFMISLNDTVPLFPIELKKRIGSDYCNSSGVIHNISGSRSDCVNITMIPQLMSENTRLTILQKLQYMFLANCAISVGCDLFNGYIIEINDKEKNQRIDCGRTVAKIIADRLGVDEIAYERLSDLSIHEILSVVVLKVIPINSTGTNPGISGYPNNGYQEYNSISIRLAIVLLIIKAVKSVLGENIFAQPPQDFEKAANKFCGPKFESDGSQVPYINRLEPTSRRVAEAADISRLWDSFKPAREEQLKICERIFINEYNSFDNVLEWRNIALCEFNSTAQLKEIDVGNETRARTLEVTLEDFVQIFNGLVLDDRDRDMIDSLLTITEDEEDSITKKPPVIVKLEIYDYLSHYSEFVYEPSASGQYLSEDERLEMKNHYIRLFKNSCLTHKKVLDTLECHNNSITSGTSISGNERPEIINYTKPILNSNIILFNTSTDRVCAAGILFATLKEENILLSPEASTAGSSTSTSSTLSAEQESALMEKLESQLKSLSVTKLYGGNMVSRHAIKLRHSSHSTPDELIDLEPYFSDVKCLTESARSITDEDIKRELLLAKNVLISPFQQGGVTS